MKEFCLLLRDMKLPIYRDSILHHVIKLIERTPTARAAQAQPCPQLLLVVALVKRRHER